MGDARAALGRVNRVLKRYVILAIFFYVTATIATAIVEPFRKRRLYGSNADNGTIVSSLADGPPALTFRPFSRAKFRQATRYIMFEFLGQPLAASAGD